MPLVEAIELIKTPPDRFHPPSCKELLAPNKKDMAVQNAMSDNWVATVDTVLECSGYCKILEDGGLEAITVREFSGLAGSRKALAYQGKDRGKGRVLVRFVSEESNPDSEGIQQKKDLQLAAKAKREGNNLTYSATKDQENAWTYHPKYHPKEGSVTAGSKKSTKRYEVRADLGPDTLVVVIWMPDTPRKVTMQRTPPLESFIRSEESEAED
jgi:hypothetical protein